MSDGEAPAGSGMPTASTQAPGLAAAMKATVTAAAQGPPEGTPKLVPDESLNMSPEAAAGVADFVLHPLMAQFTYDALSVLVESTRRERIKNWEAMKRFPERGPPFVDRNDGDSSSS